MDNSDDEDEALWARAREEARLTRAEQEAEWEAARVAQEQSDAEDAEDQELIDAAEFDQRDKEGEAAIALLEQLNCFGDARVLRVRFALEKQVRKLKRRVYSYRHTLIRQRCIKSQRRAERKRRIDTVLPAIGDVQGFLDECADDGVPITEGRYLEGCALMKTAFKAVEKALAIN